MCPLPFLLPLQPLWFHQPRGFQCQVALAVRRRQGSVVSVLLHLHFLDLVARCSAIQLLQLLHPRQVLDSVLPEQARKLFHHFFSHSAHRHFLLPCHFHHTHLEALRDRFLLFIQLRVLRSVLLAQIPVHSLALLPFSRLDHHLLLPYHQCQHSHLLLPIHSPCWHLLSHQVRLSSYPLLHSSRHQMCFPGWFRLLISSRWA